MRWFKHMSNSANDEKLCRLVDAYGLEGYGFWWRVVEIVAGYVDEKRKTSVTFSTKRWCNLLGIRPQTLRKLLLISVDCDLFAVCFNDDLIQIDIPNILKFRDEYQRKSGQSPDKIRRKKQIQNTETEEEINTLCAKAAPVAPQAQSAISPQTQAGLGFEADPELAAKLQGKSKSLSGKRAVSFEHFWTAFSDKRGKAEAIDAWAAIPDLTDSLVEKILAAAGRYAGARPALIAQGRTPKMAQGWISGRRWEDENTGCLTPQSTPVEVDRAEYRLEIERRKEIDLAFLQKFEADATRRALAGKVENG